MQKDTPEHYPDWITRVTVPAQARRSGTVTHTVCDSTATLLYLADQACITLHRWASRADAVDEPDLMIFDLDPPPATAGRGPQDDFEAVRDAAQHLHGLLDDVGLPSAAMTTGSRGLHVVVPVDGRDGFDAVRDFARQTAGALARAHPDALTTEVRKDARRGRLYLDVQRNAYAQTSVAPWSVRAAPGAPVATPLTWDQVRDPAVGARTWTMDNALEQARSKPWKGLPTKGRALGPALRRLRKWEERQS
jgi:bifunctional non-homologous end joining protein LigD